MNWTIVVNEFKDTKTKDHAIHMIHRHISKIRNDKEAIKQTLESIDIENYDSEIVVTVAMAANTYLGNDNPERKIYCKKVVSKLEGFFEEHPTLKSMFV